MTSNTTQDEELKRLRLENDRLREELTSLKTHKGYTDFLNLEEYQRYGRQMLVPELGILGQCKLKKSSVLIIGAGGLGCPAIAYLCGVGIGKLGIVDGDTVDISNLHRQIIHDSKHINEYKVESAKQFCNNLNPNVIVETYPVNFTRTNCFDIMSQYDYVLDCTDAPAIRYLINDTAVLLKKPVISASALKTEGQLSIYNYLNGPCYRCFYPQPPPPDSVLTCGDGGIVGPVVGIMGVMQAIETVKVITGHYEKQDFAPFLLMFSAYSVRSPWRYVKMRGKDVSCAVCNSDGTSSITEEAIKSGEIDYELFCGHTKTTDLHESLRVSVQQLSQALKSEDPLIIDVREPTQYEICSLPKSINVPLANLKLGVLEKVDPKFGTSLAELIQNSRSPVYVICRYGNDSREAVRLIRQTVNTPLVLDVRGGLYMWSKEIDLNFPIY